MQHPRKGVGYPPRFVLGVISEVAYSPLPNTNPRRRTQMAIFINMPFSLTVGTAAADTFILGNRFMTVLGLDGDDVFLELIPQVGFNYLDGGNGNDSFTLGNLSRENYILGGDGN